MWLDSSYIVLNSLLTELYGKVKGQASFFFCSLKLLGPKKNAAIKVLITIGKLSLKKYRNSMSAMLNLLENFFILNLKLYFMILGRRN